MRLRRHPPAGAGSRLACGSAWLSDDPRFGSQADRIVSEEELAIDPAWFPGRRVLDAGCGNGRWVDAFLRLGCAVTALDASPHAIAHCARRFGDRVRTLQGDVLEADRLLAGERFDLVCSWGVQHHTADTGRGIRALSSLVADDGLLYLYLYGRDTAPSRGAQAKLYAGRVLLNLLPLRARRALLERLFGKRRAHEAFDLFSAPPNRRTTFEEASARCAPPACRASCARSTTRRSSCGPTGAPPAPTWDFREPATGPCWFQQPAPA